MHCDTTVLSRTGTVLPPQVEAKREWRLALRHLEFTFSLRRENFFFCTRDAPTVGDFVQVSQATRGRLSPREVNVQEERRVTGSRAVCHPQVSFLRLAVFVPVLCWSKSSRAKHW